MAVLESSVEGYLARRVKESGGLCIKINPDNMNGLPDRLCVFPGGTHIWVETKRPVGGRLSAIQRHRHKQLRAVGARVYVCACTAEVDELLAEVAAVRT